LGKKAPKIQPSSRNHRRKEKIKFSHAVGDWTGGRKGVGGKGGGVGHAQAVIAQLLGCGGGYHRGEGGLKEPERGNLVEGRDPSGWKG